MLFDQVTYCLILTFGLTTGTVNKAFNYYNKSRIKDLDKQIH